MDTAVLDPVHTTVIGVFNHLEDARRTVEHLRRAGFRDDRIGFIGPDYRKGTQAEQGKHHYTLDEETGIGAAVGGAAGGVAGLAVAAGMLTPIGPAIAGGALIAWLASVGVGAAAGAAIGGLAGMGLAEEDAKWYEGELKLGRTLVVLQDVDNRAEEAREIIREHGGDLREPSEIGVYGTGLRATPY